MKTRHFLIACAISVFALAANSATFTVTTNADSGAGSLRQAIIDANAAGSASTITFDLPRAIAIIRPLTPLPEVAATVTLDGRLPVGSPANGGIEINGSSCTAPQSNGLVTSGVVSFLRFTNWNGYGIDAKGSAVVSTCTVGIGEAREPRPNANGIRAADRASIGDPNASPNTIAGVVVAVIAVILLASPTLLEQRAFNEGMALSSSGSGGLGAVSSPPNTYETRTLFGEMKQAGPNVNFGSPKPRKADAYQGLPARFAMPQPDRQTLFGIPLLGVDRPQQIVVLMLSAALFWWLRAALVVIALWLLWRERETLAAAIRARMEEATPPVAEVVAS